jgi:site-specific DNA-cytosine methylase
MVFSKLKYDYIYTPPIDLCLDVPNVEEVLTKLDEVRQTQTLLNDEIPYHTKERIEGFSKLKPGDSYYGTLNNKRLFPKRYCPVVTSHCTRHVHPFRDRVLNVREVATFQGFPLDFQFFGSESTQLDLVGKSVPPPVMKVFAESIKESIEKYENRF